MHNSLTFCAIAFGDGVVINEVFLQDQEAMSEINAGLLRERSCDCVNLYYWSIKKKKNPEQKATTFLGYIGGVEFTCCITAKLLPVSLV